MIFSQDMVIKCSIEIVPSKSGKRQITEGIELPNQERIRMFREKETYKYSGILKADTIKHVEMKEKKNTKVLFTNPFARAGYDTRSIF